MERFTVLDLRVKEIIDTSKQTLLALFSFRIPVEHTSNRLQRNASRLMF